LIKNNEYCYSYEQSYGDGIFIEECSVNYRSNARYSPTFLQGEGEKKIVLAKDYGLDTTYFRSIYALGMGYHNRSFVNPETLSFVNLGDDSFYYYFYSYYYDWQNSISSTYRLYSFNIDKDFSVNYREFLPDDPIDFYFDDFLNSFVRGGAAVGVGEIGGNTVYLAGYGGDYDRYQVMWKVNDSVEYNVRAVDVSSSNPGAFIINGQNVPGGVSSECFTLSDGACLMVGAVRCETGSPCRATFSIDDRYTETMSDGESKDLGFGDRIIVLTNYNPKMNETTIISTPEAFFNALIGKDRVSFLKEAPAVEDLDENFLELIQAYLAKHPSDITGDEIDCLPEWECSIDPLICPQHGTQLETCVDKNDCSYYENKRTIQCNPGICLGCLKDSLEGPYVAGNCVPYGFRVENFGQPQYCELDGQFKGQKTKNLDGSWASCQNNYECSSNNCIDGECVPVGEYIQRAGGISEWFFTVLCSIANPISKAEKQQCVNRFLSA